MICLKGREDIAVFQFVRTMKKNIKYIQNQEEDQKNNTFNLENEKRRKFISTRDQSL